jgi:uncharacterized protein (DUF433 family)
MPSATTGVATNPHIVLNEKGRAVVRDTRSKVTMIARDHLDGGLTPREIHEAYPHLSLAAIHAALSYYYDHQAELDAEIEASDRMVEEMRAAAGKSPLAKKWRERNQTT